MEFQGQLYSILLLPLSIYSQSTQEQIDSLRYYMHIELNEYRAEYKLKPLEISDSLNKLAQSWAEKMYNTNEFKHSIYGDRENILSRNKYISTCKEFSYWTLYHWKNSPGHNENLTNNDCTHIGYGFYNGYAVQIFENQNPYNWLKNL